MISTEKVERLIDEVTLAGLTGRGGAGFPTGRKLRAVAGQRGRAVVVANGVESEPASTKDEALLMRAPHLVLDGAVLAALATGADQVHLCLPRGKAWLVDVLGRAVAERASAQVDPVPVTVRAAPERYVSSSETALINWLNGGEAKPTMVPPRPFERGVHRRPTLLSNVETFAHLALIARHGARWFRQAGQPDAPGTMLVTISGAVESPGVYEVEAGTPIGEILVLGRAAASSAVLIGGYFGSWHEPRQVAALPLAAAGLRKIGASPGAGVLVALPAESCGLWETARVLAWLAGHSAGQCGPCLFGLAAIADDFSLLAQGYPDRLVLDRLRRRLGVVAGRGACAHPDGAVRLATSALRAFEPDVRAHARGRPCRPADGSCRSPVLPLPGPPVLPADRSNHTWV
jgi:NADH:ubiquinone oxidoreductase subunit F (NADH-binding)